MSRAALPALALALGVLASGCAPGAASEELPLARVVGSGLGEACTRADVDEGIDRRHLEPSTAAPPAALYRQVPPTSGRHLGVVHPLVIDASRLADVRATTHNLEHGAVVVHVAGDQLAPDVVAAVEAWARQLADAGFEAREAAAGILVVAMPEEATTDAAVALRAWGHGIDCATWDRRTADAFVVTHYGDRGQAPEGGLAPYPDDNGVLLDPGVFT